MCVRRGAARRLSISSCRAGASSPPLASVHACNPHRYAEVLENTQYALIATVQKLYAMVRGGEAWDLGEPELNDRGLPVIHNIAEKLGCIRRSPDMPQAFPEDAEEFAALQTQLFAAARDSSDSSEGKHSEDSVFSRLGRGDRASSSDTEHSSASNGYNQMFWEPEPELDPLTHDVFAPDAPPPADTPFGSPRKFRQELNPVRRSFNPRPVSSPPYTDLPGSSDFRGDSPFAAWSGGGEDFVSSASAVEMGSLYLQQAQPQPQSQPAQQQQRRRPLQNMQPLTTVRSSLGGAFAGDVAGSLDSSKGSVMSPTPSSIDPYANISTYLDGTIRPNMLDCDNCNLNGTLPDSMDNVMFGDYDGLTIV